MGIRKVFWLPSVKIKLKEFRSDHFSPEESFQYISAIIVETEKLLDNPVLSKSYEEESGVYKGISRILVRRFKVYYEWFGEDIIILGILFPGEK